MLRRGTLSVPSGRFGDHNRVSACGRGTRGIRITLAAATQHADTAVLVDAGIRFGAGRAVVERHPAAMASATRAKNNLDDLMILLLRVGMSGVSGESRAQASCREPSCLVK